MTRPLSEKHSLLKMCLMLGCDRLFIYMNRRAGDETVLVLVLVCM